jgi:hypothetical protein
LCRDDAPGALLGIFVSKENLQLDSACGYGHNFFGRKLRSNN